MTWNYRVLKHNNELDEVYYTIHEVYYNKQGEIESWTADEAGCTPLGGGHYELWLDLDHMMMALEKPTLQEVNGKLVEVNNE